MSPIGPRIVVWSSLQSKRTGTSNSKPAVTAWPAVGMLPPVKVTMPVAVSTVKWVESVFSVPSTATRTVPAIGLAIVRTKEWLSTV